MREVSKRRFKMIIIIGVIISVICFIFLGYEILRVKKYETSAVEKIGQYKGSFYYNIALFSTERLEKSKVVEYKYKYAGSILDDSQYILLTYQYNDSEYLSEKKRIASIKDEYASVVYNDSYFDLPAYIYMYKEGDSSEFALVNDEKKQITYVYIQCPFDFKGEKYVEQRIKLK